MTIEFEAGGVKYRQEYMSTREAFRAEIRLGKALGRGVRGSMGDINQLVNSSVDGQVFELAAATLALSEVIQHVDPDELWALALEFAKHSKFVNPEGIEVPLGGETFERHFASAKDLARLHLFFYHSVIGQLGPLWGGLGIGGRFAAASQPTASRHPSPPMSSSSTGESS